MNLKTINFENAKIDSVELKVSKCETSDPELVAAVVNWQLARRRSGSAKVKSMSEISGTTAKPFKQKGTGNARQGSKRSVQMRGGRTCFGPIPRSYDYNLSKKLIKKVTLNLLKLKVKEDKLILFKNSDNKILKTKQVNKLLKDNKIDSALFLYEGNNENNSWLKSVKNIKNVKALNYKALNTYDILKFNFLMLDNKLFETVKKIL